MYIQKSRSIIHIALLASDVSAETITAFHYNMHVALLSEEFEFFPSQNSVVHAHSALGQRCRLKQDPNLALM